MADKQANIRKTQLEREGGKVSGVQRQRRQPGWMKRNALRLQELAEQRFQEKLGDMEIDDFLDLLKRSPNRGFNWTPEQSELPRKFRLF